MDAGLKVMQEKRALCAMNPHHNLSAFLPIFFFHNLAEKPDRRDRLVMWIIV